jgi:hypothetical protein
LLDARVRLGLEFCGSLSLGFTPCPRRQVARLLARPARPSSSSGPLRTARASPDCLSNGDGVSALQLSGRHRGPDFRR